VAASVKLYLFEVEIQNIGDVKKFRHSIRELPERALVSLVDPGTNIRELCTPLGVSYRSNRERTPVRRYRKRRIRFYVKQLQNGLIQYESQAVPMLRLGFNQRDPPYQGKHNVSLNVSICKWAF
jgi:hypothetical protein